MVIDEHLNNILVAWKITDSQAGSNSQHYKVAESNHQCHTNSLSKAMTQLGA
jgi:hypothetical protein